MPFSDEKCYTNFFLAAHRQDSKATTLYMGNGWVTSCNPVYVHLRIVFLGMFTVVFLNKNSLISGCFLTTKKMNIKYINRLDSQNFSKMLLPTHVGPLWFFSPTEPVEIIRG